MKLPMGIKRVIKLGGAAITHKGSLESPNYDILRRVAQHLAEAYRIGGGLVIVHGAGSFG